MGKALRRALATADAARVYVKVPLIVDTTELITPTVAQEMLQRNTSNRPVNWNRVEEYAGMMTRGEWKLHAQGIILDVNGNVLNGQNRLWAVIYSNVSVYMRVSRGNPPEVARLIDRGTPQSARDIATRATSRKHSPVEASVALGVCVLRGVTRPSKDVLADTIAGIATCSLVLLQEVSRLKKTRGLLMILAALCETYPDPMVAKPRLLQIDALLDCLHEALRPQTPEQCWARGPAFGLAMAHAKKIVSG